MELTSTTKNGVSAYHLINGASTLGFSASGVEGELENIRKDDLPCIAHVVINRSYQHFLVLYDIDFKNKKVLVMDPAKGKKILALSEFKLMSSHKYIFLKPNKVLPNFTVKKVIRQAFFSNLKKYKTVLFIILILSFIYMVFHILSLYHFKYLIEYALTFKNIENIILISQAVLIVFIIKESANFLRNTILLKWSDIFDFQLTSKILEQIISFPYLYYKNRTTGEILARIKDLSVVKNFITTFICISIPEFLSFIIFMILLFQLNFVLASYSLFFFLSFFLIQLLFQTSHQKRLKKYLRKEENVNSYLIEVLSAFDVVKGLHMEEIVGERFYRKYLSFLENHYFLFLLHYIEEMFKNHLHHIMMVVLLFLGGRLVITGRLSLSELIVFQSILSYSSTSFQNLGGILKSYREYKVSKDRVEDLFTIRKESFAMNEYFTSQNLEGVIEYKNLSFSYHSKPLFSNFNLRIPFGRRIFITGESGNGKSTLVKMLLRYVEVPYGSVKIGGIDINHYPLATLRQKIAYVSQNEYLFTDTIYENIVMGRDIHRDEVEDIISKMHLDDVIARFPLGLDTVLEENGFNLSGGERQRFILARSVLKRSDIYIFDEASSQIDVSREREILKNIFALLKGKTIIVISHRFDNQDLFQQVIPITKGQTYAEEV